MGLKKINIGQSDTDEYKGQTVDGVEVILTLNATANNVILAPWDINLRQTSVKITYKKSATATPVEIFSSTLDVMLQIANDSTDPIKCLWAIPSINNVGILPAPYAWLMLETDGQLVVPSAGTADQRNISARLMFPCPINLSGEECIECYVNSSNGTVVAGQNANAATSFIQFGQIVGHGQGHGIPRYIVQSIPPSQGTVNAPGGDGVERMFFINMDKTDNTIANSVINNYSVQSNGKSMQIQYNEMLAARSSQRKNMFPDVRFGSHVVFEHRSHHHTTPHDMPEGAAQVNLTFSLNVGAVTASNNYIVTEAVLPDMDKMRNYMGHAAMLHNGRLAKHGFINASEHSTRNSAISNHINK